MKDELDYPDHAPTTRKIWGGAVFMILFGPGALVLLMLSVAYSDHVDKFFNYFVIYLYHNPVAAIAFALLLIATVIVMIIKSAKRG